MLMPLVPSRETEANYQDISAGRSSSFKTSLTFTDYGVDLQRNRNAR